MALITDLQTRYGPALFTYVRQLARNHHDAEDIVQETFIRAWRNADTLEPVGEQVRGWLFTVARHILIDRQRVRSAVPVGIEFDPRPAGEGADFENEVVTRIHVLEALTHLSQEQRTALIEVYYHGRSMESVARSMGIPSGTVRSRVFYGLRNLRSHFDAQHTGAQHADAQHADIQHADAQDEEHQPAEARHAKDNRHVKDNRAEDNRAEDQRRAGS